jgi:pimeloyl-ACP methyl ester carboxylesterase
MEPGYRPGEAEWLEFNHRTRFWTLGRLEDLARRLRNLVDAEWVEHGGFSDVVLIGHSLGGLLVRQAYLLAAGGVGGEDPSPWGGRVSRILLFASVNRGFDLRRRATAWLRPFVWLARIAPLPHFVTDDIVRGSNFLTNLRINWIRHFGALGDAARAGARGPDGPAGREPVVVQLLGDRDGVVTSDDSRDVLAFPRAVHINVADADHKGVYRINEAPDPPARYAVVRQALFVAPREVRPSDGPGETRVHRVVFLLHGIRASNVDEWIHQLEERIRQQDPVHTVVRRPTYGYFSAARFALPSVRRKNIAVFQDWYTEALAEHPTAEFDVIAHSNGTYLLGQSLLTTPAMQFENVVLAGSVLPQTFPWKELIQRKQVGRVRNDRANRDWPVALLCNGLSGLRMRDVGTGGFAGFLGSETTEVAYYAGGHGAALRPENLDRLVAFAFGGEVAKPELLSEPGYYRQLSNLMRYVAPTLVVFALVVLGRWIYVEGGVDGERLLWSAGALLGLYVVLDVI